MRTGAPSPRRLDIVDRTVAKDRADHSAEYA